MGRRRSLVGTLLKELERSANRAAAEQRQQQRRAATVRSRALEREMIRAERAAERQRIENERHSAEVKLRRERALATQLKVDAKEAQRREWELEVAEYKRRDEAALSVANEGPEVEDRDALFAELLAPRPWVAPDFEPPDAPPEDEDVVRKGLEPELLRRAEQFAPRYSTTNAIQLGSAAFGTAAGALALLPASPSVTVWVSLGCFAAWTAFEWTWRRRWAADRAAHLAAVHNDFEEAVRRSLAARADERLEQARSAHESRVETEEAAYVAEQEKRQAHARRLQAGDRTAMVSELEQLFPLELVPEVACRPELKSTTALSLVLESSLAAALQPSNATNLTSGKSSYRKKTQKQLREESMRYCAGLAIRHASEAMLFLPSLTEVEVSVQIELLDGASGKKTAASVLRARFPFSVLAPLQMDGLAPVDALVHFEHEWTRAPIDSEVKRMVTA